jgi:hypothetical protein
VIDVELPCQVRLENCGQKRFTEVADDEVVMSDTGRSAKLAGPHSVLSLKSMQNASGNIDRDAVNIARDDGGMLNV